MPSRKASARRHVRLNARRCVTAFSFPFGRWRDPPCRGDCVVAVVLFPSVMSAGPSVVTVLLTGSRCSCALGATWPCSCPPSRCSGRPTVRRTGAWWASVRNFLASRFRSEWQGGQRSVGREETQWAPCRGRHARSSFRRLEPVRIAGRQTDRTADREQQNLTPTRTPQRAVAPGREALPRREAECR